jgi:nucleotide-binding universal stress UspA family protein
MYMRLLVPLDGTSEAATALPAARTLARATGATLTLIRVTEDRVGDSPGANSRIQQIDNDLRETAEPLVRDNLRVDWLVRTGPIARAIIEAAAVGNTDLIVMATHGRTGLGRAFAENTSERVIADSGLRCWF